MEASSAVRSRGTKEDRMSDLPDSLIQHILSFLPTTREAVRTGILSKRWRDQWTHLPDLIFEPWLGPGDEYFSFIENTLALHDSPIIKKLHLCYDYSSNLDPQFTSKVCFAVSKCVQELILICHSCQGPYLLPKFLIECASLERLEMYNCCIKSNQTVNLPSLKSLKMSATCFCDNDCNKGIENIVSGCPLLEWLELRGYIDGRVAIVSKSLKVLSFVNARILDAKISYAIKFRCPNLVELNMEHSTFHDQMIENVLLGCPCIHSLKLVNCGGYKCPELVIASNSLKVLHLDHVYNAGISVSCPKLVKLDMLCYGDAFRKAVNLPSTVCITLDYIHPWDGHVETEFLEQFQHVSTLTFMRSLVEVISDDVLRCPPLPLLNCKCLTLNIGAHFGLALPSIAHALRSAMLETLVVKLDSNFHEDFSQEDYQDIMSSRLDYWNSVKSTSFTCLISHLKTMEIKGLYERDDNCEIVLEFIEYLLKSARVLEKMIVSLENSRKSCVIKVSQKMLSFPRYSQCASVELLCST